MDGYHTPRIPLAPWRRGAPARAVRNGPGGDEADPAARDRSAGASGPGYTYRRSREGPCVSSPSFWQAHSPEGLSARAGRSCFTPFSCGVSPVSTASSRGGSRVSPRCYRNRVPSSNQAPHRSASGRWRRSRKFRERRWQRRTGTDPGGSLSQPPRSRWSGEPTSRCETLAATPKTVGSRSRPQPEG